MNTKAPTQQAAESEKETLEILSGEKAFDHDGEKTDAQSIYSEDEKKYWQYLCQKLADARSEREQNHPEFDGMTYTQYYESNRKKDLSYIPPKKNRRDVRIVSGTTREKDTTLLSSVLELNLEPNITAFDEDNFIVANLGNHTENLVKKSRELEEYNLQKSTIYRELISQGDVFLEEYYDEGFVPTCDLDEARKWSPDTAKISDFKDPQFTLKKKSEGCKVRRIKGTRVYLGSVRIENIQDQDMVAVTRVFQSRQAAEAVYGKWERWQYVPEEVNQTTLSVDENNLYRDWNIVQVPKGKVFEIRIYLPKMNRFMIMLNGTMMLPHLFPMTAVCPTGKHPIIQGKAEPISDFAYSKSTPSKVKVQQEVFDEITRLMINKFRQSAQPTLGYSGKNIISPAIFDSGKVFSNMKKNMLFPVIPDRQINSSEFSFYNVIKEQIENNTANATFSGEAPDKQVTLGQLQIERNQQMKKLGLLLDGVLNLEKQLVWHRIYNIYANWTKPIDSRVAEDKKTIKEVYRQITVDAELENEEKGYKVFRFRKGNEFPDKYAQYDEEKELSNKTGKKMRIVYLNSEELASLKHLFFVSMTPSDAMASELSQMVFTNHVREAMELFGPESLQIDYIKQRWAHKIKENPDKWFKASDLIQSMLTNYAQEKGGANKPMNSNPNTNQMPKMGKTPTIANPK